MFPFLLCLLAAPPLEDAHAALARGELVRAAELAEAVRGPDERDALELARAISDAQGDITRGRRVAARLGKLPPRKPAATPDPFPSSAPLLVNQPAFVRVARANVRESASDASRIATVLPINSEVKVLGLVREWAVIPGRELNHYVLAELLAPAPVPPDALVRRAEELTKAKGVSGAAIALERAFVALRAEPARRDGIRAQVVSAALAARRYPAAVEAVSAPAPVVLESLAPEPGAVPGTALLRIIGRDDGIEYVRVLHDTARAWVRVDGRIVELPRTEASGDLAAREGARSMITFAHEQLSVTLLRTLSAIGDADDCRVFFFDVDVIVRNPKGVQKIAARYQIGC